MASRESVGRWLAAALALALAPSGAIAQQLKIFDSHLHFNDEATAVYSVERVLDIFRRSNVAGILANSRPNLGTQKLVEAKAPGLWVVPFIRPYRVLGDVQSWYTDRSIYELIETEYKRGYYRGIGEFHIYGDAAAGPWVKKTVNFAVEHDLTILAHCDETALELLFKHNGKARIVWAHTGFTTPTAQVGGLLEKYPALTAELSYRSGITGGSDRLSAEWRDLFARHSDRFVLGSDTWVNPRWSNYGGIMSDYRSWLAQLPDDQARRIAYGNAERLYGGKID